MAGLREGLSYQRLSKKIGKMNNSSGEVQIGFQEEETKRRTPATAGKLAGPVSDETEESCRYSGFKRGVRRGKGLVIDGLFLLGW